jgi:hypothetical protein
MLLLAASVRAGDDRPARSGTAAEKFAALAKEFHEAAHAYYLKATNDEDRTEPTARIIRLSPRCLELAENNPQDPVALDALVQVVTQELWLMGNTLYPGRGKDNLEAKAIALLLRDHVRSERLGEACRRASYGFSKDCEIFLRTVLEKNPHRGVQALACLRLAQFLNRRLQQLDVLKERPDMAKRYGGLVGKDYLAALQAQDRGQAIRDAEAFFERAIERYGEVKVPYGDTVATQAKSELHEIRHLTVGREAQEIEGRDQEGKDFKLSDYRGQVVLLYFWSQY